MDDRGHSPLHRLLLLLAHGVAGGARGPSLRGGLGLLPEILAKEEKLRELTRAKA